MAMKRGYYQIVILTVAVVFLIMYGIMSIHFQEESRDLGNFLDRRSVSKGNDVDKSMIQDSQSHSPLSGDLNRVNENDYDYVISAINDLKNELKEIPTEQQDLEIRSGDSPKRPSFLEPLENKVLYPDIAFDGYMTTEPQSQRPRTDYYPEKLSNNCSFFARNVSLVRNCVSGEVIGRIPQTIHTKQFPSAIDTEPRHGSENKRKRMKSFQSIFQNRIWGHSWNGDKNGSDASGRGATLEWTQEVIATLHTVINDIKRTFGISRVKMLDVPCGDMVWMSRFLLTRDDIDYTGIDIVPELVQTHRESFKNQPNWEFRNQDIVEDKIVGQFHLILCRTLLQHLFDSDIFKVLYKFSTSGSAYLLATTFSGQHLNFDLDFVDNPGRFRETNLEIPPFSLTPPLCLQRDGPPGDFEGWKHFLGLWALPLRQVKRCDRIKEFKLMGTSHTIASCVEWSPYIDLDS